MSKADIKKKKKQADKQTNCQYKSLLENVLKLRIQEETESTGWFLSKHVATF